MKFEKLFESVMGEETAFNPKERYFLAHLDEIPSGTLSHDEQVIVKRLRDEIPDNEVGKTGSELAHGEALSKEGRPYAILKGLFSRGVLIPVPKEVGADEEIPALDSNEDDVRPEDFVSKNKFGDSYVNVDPV